MSKSPIEQYLALESRAGTAENKADEYRQRADHDRWEQCRIVHEAVTSGEYDRTTFSKAVGRTAVYIGRQFKAWTLFGNVHATERPSYTEGMAEAVGSTPDAESKRIDISKTRKVLKDPDLLAGVPASELAEAIAQHPDAARAVARNDKARERVEDEAIEHRARNVDPDAKEKMERIPKEFKGNLAKKYGDDAATDDLKLAANFIAQAVGMREMFPVEDTVAEAEALANIKHWLAVYEADTSLSDADRHFLAELGIAS